MNVIHLASPASALTLCGATCTEWTLRVDSTELAKVTCKRCRRVLYGSRS